MTLEEKIDRLICLIDDLTPLLEGLILRQQSPWLTVREAADYARMGKSTVTRAIHEGLLPSDVPPAKDKHGKRRAMARRLVHRDDVDRWFANRTGRGRRPKRQSMRLLHEGQRHNGKEY